MFEDEHDLQEHEQHRPLSMVLLGGLYLFFFVLTASTYGNPFPFMGRIYEGLWAQALVFVDSLFMLYLFLGLMKRQKLTWYLLMGYNAFEALNTIVNLIYISSAEVERIAGKPVDPEALLINNIVVLGAILFLSLFIYRQRPYFTNLSRYVF